MVNWSIYRQVSAYSCTSEIVSECMLFLLASLYTESFPTLPVILKNLCTFYFVLSWCMGTGLCIGGYFSHLIFFFHLFFTCGLLIALLSLVEVQGDASVHADAPWKLMGAKGAFKFPAKIPFKNLLLLEILQLSRKSKGKTNFLVQSLCKRAVKSVSNNCYGQEWLC